MSGLPRITAVILVLLSSVCLASPSGRVVLVVQQAVPFAGSASPYDLHLDLTCRQGTFDPQGWAYVDALPAVEHSVRVQQAKVQADSLRLELSINFSHQLPEAFGGQATLTLELNLSGTQLEGTYLANFTALDEEQRRSLWESLGGNKAPLPQRGLRSGRTESLTHLAKPGVIMGVGDHVPIVARGRIDPLPATLPASGQLKRPVLLGAQTLADMRTRAKTGDGQRIVGDIAQRLQEGRHGNVLSSEPVACDGFAAAGYAALHAIHGESGAAAKALELALQSVRQNDTWRMPRALVGAALAYDLASADWPAPARTELRAALLRQARRLSGLDQSAAGQAAFVDDAILGKLEGPYDYRLASARAAVGLAMLAIVPDAADSEQADIAGLLGLSRRGIERFLRAGIGDQGASTGNYGYISAIETVFPFLQAWKQAAGEDLADGTGARRTALWGMSSRGLVLDQGPQFAGGFWLALAGGALERRHSSGMAWYWQRYGTSITNPLHGIYALANMPSDQPQTPTWPLVLHDRRMGALLARSGWDDARDFVMLCELGSATPHNAAMRGHFSLWGMDREWVRRTPVPFGTYRWPRTQDCNVLQVRESELTRRGALQFEGGGLLQRLWADRNGSASIAMSTRGFVDPDQKDNVGDSKSWRVAGIDYGRSSGAAALLVMIEGAVGLADRQQVWEIDVGNVPASQVKIQGLSFVVSPKDSKATMQGTFLYPTTVFLEYAPPAGDRGGRIKAYRQKPGEKSLTRLMQALDNRLDAQIQAMLKDEDSNIDIRKFDLPLDAPNTSEEERWQRQSQIIYLKLLKETSSVKMGGGDRPPRAKANLVVVLTVQEGQAPPVKVLDNKSDALVRVGEQTVSYVENLIQFGRRP